MQRLTDHREASCENQAKRERSCGGWNSDAREPTRHARFPLSARRRHATAAHCCPRMPTDAHMQHASAPQ